MNEKNSTQIQVTVSAETREQIEYLTTLRGHSLRETAEKLLAEQADAEASLERGPWLRKHMYR